MAVFIQATLTDISGAPVEICATAVRIEWHGGRVFVIESAAANDREPIEIRETYNEAAQILGAALGDTAWQGRMIFGVKKN